MVRQIFANDPSPTVNRYMTQPMRQSRVHTVLAVVFGFFTLNAWVQVLLTVLGRSDDPRALAVPVLVLLGAALVAAGLPAWRAARIDPMQALRHE